MDSRTLRNLMRIVQTGSLSAAAEHSCLTVQALAAQLNKVEEQFGFRLFRRSNKGLTLTTQGTELTPYMDKVLVATRQLEEKVAALKVPGQRTLKVALNTTLSEDFNRRMIGRLIDVFPEHQLEFSYAESMENLSKLTNEDFDLAVLIGPQRPGLPSIVLPEVQVTVVGAHCGQENDPLVLLGDKLQVRPADDCPYSHSFLRFLDAGLGHYESGQRMIYSCSETLTLSLITQMDGLGMVSREAALRNGLSIFPDFEDFLEVRLAINNPELSGQALSDVLDLSLHERPKRDVRRRPNRHTEEEVLAEIRT
ncbi:MULTISPECIES: LysR family transcriptional regulator [unclassified Pseudomonas]|uniref:LysR family transcriptional regulator n=1 Tax=unclassified Pseudomonas TaxID=196821 RepID=UPI002AC9A0C0|nr:MULTISPECIES: LysR family transcriptional regulator [unclassified Pseudomonas]MEB0047803.1 LysR family transcriptional regulator [Pseudomonas sp. Dout3]MEB0098294.1 LysR family transcriptional regulator [Pseudomonas sp. DC1.2]WPX59250.1 LysR family transcriptional regulator [Pseudomonas sp. DC1.2]